MSDLVPVSVEVAPILISFIPTQTTKFVAKTYNIGHEVLAETYSWVSSDAGVATVHPTSGLVTAVANGTATITATGDDSSLSDAGTVEVVDAPTWSSARRTVKSTLGRR